MPSVSLAQLPRPACPVLMQPPVATWAGTARRQGSKKAWPQTHQQWCAFQDFGMTKRSLRQLDNAFTGLLHTLQLP